MSRATGPLTEDPRWTDQMKANWEAAMTALPAMWDETFDLVRGAGTTVYCGYGEHWACQEFVAGQTRNGSRCECGCHRG